MIALLAVPFLVYFAARSLYGGQNIETRPVSSSSTIAKKVTKTSPETTEAPPPAPKELVKSEEAKQAVHQLPEST